MAVRDGRKHHFFIVDNAVLDVRLSPYAVTLYCWLARFADKRGESFPSVGTLADRMGVSRPTVRKALRELVENGLVDVEEGIYRSHRFRLLPVQVETTFPPEAEVETRFPGVETTFPEGGNVVCSNNTQTTISKEQWQRVLEDLRLCLTPPAFELYVSRLEARRRGNVLELSGPAMALEWVDRRLRAVVERSVRRFFPDVVGVVVDGG